MTPLTDLGAATYRGYHGGLYPGMKNVPGSSYLARGLAAARNVKPIGGKIVLASIGMSNTTLEFEQFQREAHPASDVVLVDGAFPGQDAEKIKDPSYAYWSRVDGRLTAAGATAAQVQVVWRDGTDSTTRRACSATSRLRRGPRRRRSRPPPRPPAPRGRRRASVPYRMKRFRPARRSGSPSGA